MSKLALKDTSWSFCAANHNSNLQLHSFLDVVLPSLSQSLASLQSLTAWKVTCSKLLGKKKSIIPGSWINWNPDQKQSFLFLQNTYECACMCVKWCILVHVTTSCLSKIPQQFQLCVMSFSTSSPERLQSSFLKEMHFPGESLNYCTELQVLAWVQEVSQSLSIHHFQFSRKSVAITSSCRPTFNSFTDANSFLESQQLPLTFKLFLVPVSSKTYRIFWGGCYSYKTKNTPHQPCFKILLIAHYSLQSPVFSRL